MDKIVTEKDLKGLLPETVGEMPDLNKALLGIEKKLQNYFDSEDLSLIPVEVYHDLEIHGSLVDSFLLSGEDNTRLQDKGYVLHKLLTSYFFMMVPDFRPVIKGKDKPISYSYSNSSRKVYLPGHHYKFNGQYGPRKFCDIMVIGKYPGNEELVYLKNFIGPSGKLLRDLLEEFLPKSVIEEDKVYITNLYKVNLSEHDPVNVKYIHLFKPILLAEIRLLRPRYIIALGHDVIKALVGTREKFANYINRPVDLVIDYVNISPDSDKERFTTTVFAMKHPAHFLRNPDLLPEIQNSFKLFSLAYKKNLTYASVTENKIKYSVDNTDAFSIIDNKLLEAKSKGTKVKIVLDCEWHSKWYAKDSFFLRLIQIGIEVKDKTKIFLFDCLKNKMFLDRFIDVLLNKNNQKYIRLVGHNITSDILALCAASGRRIEEFYNLLVPPNITNMMVYLLDYSENSNNEEFYRLLHKLAEQTKTAGVFDTMLAAHTLDETGAIDLKQLSQRYLGFPPYDLKLAEYIKQQKQLNSDEEEGFGFVPESILFDYAAWDIAATDGLYKLFNEDLLDNDPQTNRSCREPFYLASCAIYPYAEAQYYGTMIDYNVFTQLHQQFKSKAEQVLNEIREAINWSDFSGKGYHRTEFVYGYRPGMKQSRVSPETARLLCFPPLIDPEQHQQQYTGSIPISSDNIDYPEEIEDYRDEEEILTFLATKTKTPYPTNQLALSLLMQKYAGNPQYYRKIELLNKFRHFCLLTSMLERVLSIKPTTGLLKYKRVDEKGNIYLHPTFLNILKTGRTCIIRPNLQNLSKKREEDYSTIFGDDYKHPVRSIVQSRPGYCLVEMDLVAAELVILAIVSGDEHLYSLCMRSMLPKDNPDYLDIHSYIALKILRRDDIKPTKNELERHGLIHYRTLAKTAIYGLVYGQTAENFFIVSRVNGLPLKSIKEAEEFIYKLEEQFPKLIRFIKNIVPRFIYQNFYSYNCFGRLRRFSKISENTFGDRALFKKLMGKNIREGVNFIPQSIVADIISLTAASIQNIKQLYNLDFRLVLQLHDALLYEVKDEDVEKFIPVVENIVKNIKIKANYMENGIGYGALKPEIKIYPNNWGLD